MTTYQNKADLIAGIKSERQQIDNLVEEILAQEANAESPQTRQQAQEIIAHLTSWEALLLSWLVMAANGVPPSAAINAVITDHDGVNAQFQRDNESRTLEDVRASAERVFEQLIEQLNALPDPADDVRWSVWRDGEPPWALIIGNTIEHYHEHRVDLHEYLRN